MKTTKNTKMSLINNNNNRLTPNFCFEKLYLKNSLIEFTTTEPKMENNEDKNMKYFVPTDIKLMRNLEDNVNKIEYLFKDSIFISLGFSCFIKHCMKGFNYIRIYKNNYGENRKSTTLQEFILFTLCFGEYKKITNSYGYLDYEFPADFPNINKIKNNILNGNINPYKLSVLESMLHSYLNESNIYTLWHKMPNITIEDHNYFMRFFIALSALYRLDFSQMIEIGTRFFEFYNQDPTFKNKKLPIDFYADLFDYDPILEFFYEQSGTKHQKQHVPVNVPVNVPVQVVEPVIDESTLLKLLELSKKVDEMKVYIKVYFNGKTEESIFMNKLIQSEMNIKKKIIQNPKDNIQIGNELYSVLLN